MSKFIHTFIATLFLTVSSPLFLGCDETSVSSEDRSVDLSADDIASLPDGKAYVLSSQGGVTYHIDPSAGELDLSRVMLIGHDGTAISLEQALRNAPELAHVDPALLGSATMTIRSADAMSAAEAAVAVRKATDVCAVVFETDDYIFIIIFDC